MDERRAESELDLEGRTLRERLGGRLGRRQTAATLLAFGLGASLAVGGALVAARADPPRPGAIALWVADRDASLVHGLDPNLYVTTSFPVDWPLDVEPASDGGLWVLRSGGPTAASTQRIDRYASDGTLITELWIEGALDFDVLAGGLQALYVEARADGPDRLVRVREEGSIFPLLERDGLACCLGARDYALAGTRDGRVVRVTVPTGAIERQRLLGGSIADLAPGPEPETAWALDVSGPGRVLLLGPDLAPRWEVALPRPAAHLAPVRGEERVWLAATGSPCVVRIGPGGAVELDRCGLPLPGLDRALAWHDGVLLAAPGAVLRLDASGALATGQGGFALLSDLAPRAR